MPLSGLCQNKTQNAVLLVLNLTKMHEHMNLVMHKQQNEVIIVKQIEFYFKTSFFPGFFFNIAIINGYERDYYINMFFPYRLFISFCKICLLAKNSYTSWTRMARTLHDIQCPLLWVCLCLLWHNTVRLRGKEGGRT